MDRKPEANAPLSPTEIRSREFSRAMWGYSPKEVVDFLEQMAKERERLLKQEKELAQKNQELTEECLRWKGREAEIQRIRDRAVVEAENIRKAAIEESQKMYAETESRVKEIRQKTEEWLETVIAQAEETERQRHSFVTAFRSALDSHYELLKREEAQAEAIGTRLSHFLKQALNPNRSLSN